MSFLICRTQNWFWIIVPLQLNTQNCLYGDTMSTRTTGVRFANWMHKFAEFESGFVLVSTNRICTSVYSSALLGKCPKWSNTSDFDMFWLFPSASLSCTSFMHKEHSSSVHKLSWSGIKIWRTRNWYKFLVQVSWACVRSIIVTVVVVDRCTTTTSDVWHAIWNTLRWLNLMLQLKLMIKWSW